LSVPAHAEVGDSGWGLSAGYLDFIKGSAKGPCYSVFGFFEPVMFEIGWMQDTFEGEKYDFVIYDFGYIDSIGEGGFFWGFGPSVFETPDFSEMTSSGGYGGQYGANGQLGYRSEDFLFRFKYSWFGVNLETITISGGYVF
ncbi:MAG: hypothetical protein ABIC40_00305, partial [bacterium]